MSDGTPSEPDQSDTLSEGIPNITPSRNDHDNAPQGNNHKLLFVDAWVWDSLGGMVAVIGMFGILFGVWEYRQQGEAARARETLQYIEIWETRGSRGAYQLLSGEVETLLLQISQADKIEVADDSNARQKLYEGISRRILRKQENISAFIDTEYFFTRLALCIEANLCSEKVAQVFFEDTLDSFIEVFGSQIVMRQKTRPTFGASMLNLSRNIWHTQ